MKNYTAQKHINIKRHVVYSSAISVIFVPVLVLVLRYRCVMCPMSA